MSQRLSQLRPHAIVAAWIVGLVVCAGLVAKVHGQTGQERYPLNEMLDGLARAHNASISTSQIQDLPPTDQPAIERSAPFGAAPQSAPKTANAQPPIGDNFFGHTPQTGPGVMQLPFASGDFAPDAIDPCVPFDPSREINVYEGKRWNRTQRPLVEWPIPYYAAGQLPPGFTLLGETNLLLPQFLVYGDYRVGAATNRANNDELTQIAMRLNLELDLKLTATERFHAFVRPFDHGAQFTRVEIDSGNWTYFPEFDFNFDNFFFEGDLGAMWGGATDQVLPFDLPFAVGKIPLLLQNGIWLEDAFLGAAATIPARNSPRLDISNYDVTFFCGFDDITSPVFQGDKSAAKMYGVASFIEAYGGYIEAGYAFLQDRTFRDRSYHNIGLAYTRRYGKLSNSVRVIGNAGQDPNGQAANADGVLLLLENSLITRRPYSIVPYFNMFAGFGRPQSVARAAGSGGILRNTGINFETDGLTNYPTLDATGTEAWGGAVGINMLGNNLSHQLIFEFAFLQTMGVDALRPAADDQYGFGTRYQLPLNNSVIFRADAMYGFFANDDDVSGIRFELRKKF